MTRRTISGNRAFWTLVGASAALRIVLLYGICCLAMVVLSAVQDDGMSALWTSRPGLLPSALILLLTGVGMLREMWSLGRALQQTFRFTRRVRDHRIAVPVEVATISGGLGIGGRVRVVDGARPFALTYGLRRPRILLSTGLLRSLNNEELAAVLAHERAHVRNRDPLKNMVARMIPARHFYLPGMTHLSRRFTVGRELAADRSAIARHGIAALAGSLLKVSEGPAWARSVPVAAMAGDEVLAARIAQMETGAEPPLPRPGRLAIAGMALTVAALVSACAWSALVIANSMPGCT
jgi:hypothetical protein